MNTLGTDHSPRRVKPPWAAFVTLATFWVTACQERQADPGTFQATDSAGVTVVESTGPVWPDGEGWTLSPEPEIIIGAVFCYIEGWYNPRRRHSSLGYLSPAKFEAKHWPEPVRVPGLADSPAVAAGLVAGPGSTPLQAAEALLTQRREEEETRLT